MNQPLDELYLTWLYGQISSIKLNNPAETYWSLARQLFTTEFVWFVPNDDNRLEDGRELRWEFVRDRRIDPSDIKEWLNLGCSVLELLIGLSRRLSFEDDREPREWFWQLIRNLDLERYSDDNYDEAEAEKIADILEAMIYRRYSRDGSGGLFPLKNPRRDQRKVEIWYQLNAYLLENE